MVRKLTLKKVNNIEEIAGHGVQADVDGKKVSAGNIKLMKNLESIQVTNTMKEQ